MRRKLRKIIWIIVFKNKNINIFFFEIICGREIELCRCFLLENRRGQGGKSGSGGVTLTTLGWAEKDSKVVVSTTNQINKIKSLL